MDGWGGRPSNRTQELVSGYLVGVFNQVQVHDVSCSKQAGELHCVSGWEDDRVIFVPFKEEGKLGTRKLRLLALVLSLSLI